MLLGRQGTLPEPQHISERRKLLLEHGKLITLFNKPNYTRMSWKMNLGNNNFPWHVYSNCLSVTSNVCFAITRKRDTLQ